MIVLSWWYQCSRINSISGSGMKTIPSSCYISLICYSPTFLKSIICTNCIFISHLFYNDTLIYVFVRYFIYLYSLLFISDYLFLSILALFITNSIINDLSSFTYNNYNFFLHQVVHPSNLTFNKLLLFTISIIPLVKAQHSEKEKKKNN